MCKLHLSIGGRKARLLAKKFGVSLHPKRMDRDRMRKTSDGDKSFRRYWSGRMKLRACSYPSTPRYPAEGIAEQAGHAVGTAPTRMSNEELASPQNSSELFSAPAIIDPPKYPLPVVVDQHLITVESSRLGQEAKTFQERDITVTVRAEKTEEGAPMVPIGDDPSIAPEIFRPPPDAARIAPVRHRIGEPPAHPKLAFRLPQQQQAAVRRLVAAVKIDCEFLAMHRC